MTDAPLEEHEKNWPAWFYGPDGAAEIFQSEADVPKGWEDHPSKVKASKGTKPLDL